MTNPKVEWILFGAGGDAIQGLEWLPETSLTQAEWDEAKSIAAFLVDDGTLLDRALKQEVKYTSEIVQAKTLFAAMFGPQNVEAIYSGQTIEDKIQTGIIDATIKAFVLGFGALDANLKIP